MVYDYDLFVIGAGSAGVRAARMAAQKGVKVAVAEGAPLGGTCVNLGCIPKKLYSYAAHYAHAFEEAKGFGWEVGEYKFDWQTLKQNRAQEISRLNQVYDNLLSSSGVTIYRDWASVVDAHTVHVSKQSTTAKYILIATGGWPMVPDIPGKEYAITSNEIFDLPEFPSRLVIVGGGYIACEFASIFAGLGAQVTQLYRSVQILRGFDGDVRNFVADEMRKDGVDLRVNCQVQSIHKNGAELTVKLQDGTEICADQVLYATGRTARLENLNLQKVNVALGDRGEILVNHDYQTSIPSIYALGDVTQRIQLTPVALGEAMALVDHLFGDGKRQMNYDLIPSAIFTNPNVATVGLTEEQARAANYDVQIFLSDFRPLKHTLSGSKARVLMKLIVDKPSDRILGLHMVGDNAGEIVQGFTVALKLGATKAQFDSTIGIHPTAAEEFVMMRTPQ